MATASPSQLSPADEVPAEAFRVETPLVLRKPAGEHVKTVIRDLRAALGFDAHGWKRNRQNYYSPDVKENYLEVARLDGPALANIQAYSERTLADYKATIDAIPDARVPGTVQFQILPLVKTLLQAPPVHSRVADVGCCYARINGWLCREFPSVTWDMIDFPANLEAENRSVAQANMNFISGYPLEILENSPVRYDIVMFNRTLEFLSPEQCRAYLRVLKERTRFVVFGEACKILFESGNLNIDSIPVEQPRSYRTFLVHNYRKIFESCGYELLHYDAQMSPQVNATPMHFMIRGVARA